MWKASGASPLSREVYISIISHLNVNVSKNELELISDCKDMSKSAPFQFRLQTVLNCSSRITPTTHSVQKTKKKRYE